MFSVLTMKARTVYNENMTFKRDGWEMKIVASAVFYEFSGTQWTSKFGGQYQAFGRIVKETTGLSDFESEWSGFVSDGCRQMLSLSTRKTAVQAQEDVELFLAEFESRKNASNESVNLSELKEEIF